MSQIPIDLQDLLRRQTTERYHAVLVTGSAACGKSDYAKKLADALSARYLDLLNEFIENEDLSAKIDTFDRQKLFDLLKLKAQGGKILILILDNLDFLINTWGDRARREFCEWLGKLDSVQCPTVLCVFAQDDEAFSGVDYTTTSAGSRIIRFQDLQAI
jgi:hypothetical protein